MCSKPVNIDLRKEARNREKVARVAWWSTLLCAIHCLATPLLLFAVPAFGAELVHDTWFEPILLTLGVSFSGYLLIGDFRKHKNILPLLMATTGFFFLIVGHHYFHSIEMLSLVIGSVLVPGALYLNFRVNRKLGTCPVK